MTRGQERDKWEGEASEKPRPLKPKEKEAIKAKASERLIEEYVAERIVVRKLTAAAFLQAQRNEKAEVETLSFLFEHLMHDFIHEVAYEEVHVGLETKVRPLGNSGLNRRDLCLSSFNIDASRL
jgi:hypothetical protein